jgi:UDP-glucose 4-epimerase
VSRWLEADVSADALREVTRGATPAAFVHCAGSGVVGFAYEFPFEDYRRGVVSAALLLEHVRACHKAEPRVVLVSSAAVYGDQGVVDLVETNARSPISPYGFDKVAAENLCDAYSRFFGVRTSVVRLFSVYGEGLRKQLLWDAMSKFSRGESRFFGTGDELRDWIHVEDAAALLCAAAMSAQPAFGVYNGGHVKATTRQVLTELARWHGAGATPEFTGETHVGNPRCLTANWQHAERQLCWSPRIRLDEGLERYARWFKSLATQGG